MHLLLFFGLPTVLAVSETYWSIDRHGEIQRATHPKNKFLPTKMQRLMSRGEDSGETEEHKPRAHAQNGTPRMYYADLDDEVFHDTFKYPVLPEISRCKSNASSLTSAFPSEHCHGHSSSSQDSSGGAPKWGLSNSSNCPVSNFLLDQFPALHQKWKAAGQILLVCVKGALGNLLKGLTSAFLFSVRLERAFVIHCDGEWDDSSTSVLMKDYFESPLIDWTDNFVINENIPVVDLRRNYTTFPDSVADAPIVQLRSQWDTHDSDENLERIALILGEEFGKHPNLRGCLLRYLLMPSKRIEDAIQALPNSPPVQADGNLAAIAMHVRVGDAVFISNNRISSWKWAREVLPSPMIRKPLDTLHCLAKQSDMGSDCLQTIVVSDSQDVLDCAEAVLDRPVITPGVPVHMAMESDSADPAVKSNVFKVFLDWWLLARSYIIANHTNASQTIHGARFSTFFGTALGFRNSASEEPSLLQC